MLLISAHMDDFKATGSRGELDWLLQLLRQHFGDDVKCEVSRDFVHTGIRHRVAESLAEATLDQFTYAAALRPYVGADLKELDDAAALTAWLASVYSTLLGATAWLLQTRPDIAVYVSSLQRAGRAPTALHLRRLNRVVRFVQRQPVAVTLRRLELPVRLLCIGDSAFQSQEDGDPLVMRGMVFALAHRKSDIGDRRRYQTQLLEWTAGRQKHVARGVWSAELFNQCDLIDFATVLLGFFEELRRGPMTHADLAHMREDGGFSLAVTQVTDSMSIFTYLAAGHERQPTERGTIFHLGMLREALTIGMVDELVWCDTRDMAVDGMTKGSIDRAGLHRLMAGTWHLNHPVQTCSLTRHGEASDERGRRHQAEPSSSHDASSPNLPVERGRRHQAEPSAGR